MLVRSTVIYISVFALWNECMIYISVIFHTLYTCSKRYIYTLYIAFFIEMYIQKKNLTVGHSPLHFLLYLSE